MTLFINVEGGLRATIAAPNVWAPDGIAPPMSLIELQAMAARWRTLRK